MKAFIGQQQVSLVSVKAVLMHVEALGLSLVGSQLWGGVLHDNDDTYMTPLGRFGKSRSA